MKRFEINHPHIKEQFEYRYKNFADRSEEIIDRVLQSLTTQTPDDWRFTESPSSRFFVIEEESNAKFMGMSFRDGPQTRAVVSEVQNNLHNLKYLFDNLNQFVDAYLQDVLNPDLPIIHVIRTVYPRKKGDIAEERRLFESTKSTVSHIIPLAARKIASRPNAVVSKTGVLWVRQYMNWMSMKEGEREYYLFFALTQDGIQKHRRAVFSYSDGGKLDLVSEQTDDAPQPDTAQSKSFVVSIERGSGIRSESYWKSPTYLDRRLIDLDFKERHLHRSKSSFYIDDGRTMSLEILELYVLNKIVEKARNRMNAD